MKKCFRQTLYCDICINYIGFQKILDRSFLFSYFKAYIVNENSTIGDLLNINNNDFYIYTNKLQMICINHFPVQNFKNKFGKKLKLNTLSIVHITVHVKVRTKVTFFKQFIIFSTITFLNQNLFLEKSLIK